MPQSREDPDRSPTDLGTYYDRLRWWTSIARLFGYGGGSQSFTVHRLLTDPAAGGRATATRLHDLIAAALPPLNEPRILDAGCGLGGTMLDLARRFEGRAIGLTLSEAQCRAVGRLGAANRLADRISASVRSYDNPPAGPFDLIVAIESLAHSPDPSISLDALARVLAPGGALVVVDDMPEATAFDSPAIKAFREGWKVPVVWTRQQFLAAFTRHRLLVTADCDLTEQLVVRTIPQIGRLERLNRACYRLSPRRWRLMLDSYYGGLALERLYREGKMRYRLLVASRERAPSK